MAQAQRLVQERDRSHFKNLQEAQRILGGSTPLGQSLGVSSRFFEVRARLRLDKLIVEERSVLERNGTDVRVVGRERAIVDPNARQQVASPRR
jgi:general secretion pathway protein K